MKRIVIILIIIAFGGYLVQNYYKTKGKEAARQKAEKEKAAAFKEKTKTDITAMVSRFAAIDDWEEKLLEGDSGGEKRVLTMELEKLWLTGKPILFQGFVRDVSSLNPGHYLVLIDHLPRKGVGKLKLGTSLRLSLECPKATVDLFLTQNPRASSRGALIAVIAKVNSIESFSLRKTEGGETEEIKRGRGKCLAMSYVGLFQEMLTEK
jgi:hypothetical protein